MPLRCVRMRFYAERPGRLARQLIADLLVIGWVYLCVTVALAAQELITQLQGPGRALVTAGDAIRGTFDSAASTAGGVPIVGDDLAAALGTGSGAGVSLADAGREQIETVSVIALGTAIGIVALFAAPVVLVWLALRLRYAHRARAAVAVRNNDTDLLALRALAHVQVRTLLAISPDPASAWRRDDRTVIHRLAALELRSLGLRAPAPPD